MRSIPRKYTAFLFPAVLVLAADLATKRWAVDALALGPKEVIRGFFSLSLAFNEGGAWGFLARWDSPARNLFFIGASALAGAVILYMLIKSPGESVDEPAAWGLIYAGAIGNVVDRLCMGKVVDFLLVYYKRFYWPTFNVADSGITVGAILLVLLVLLKRDGEKIQ